MTIQLLTFSGDLNTSLQVGDIVYYSPTGGSGGFTTVNSAGSLVLFGVVEAIYHDAINNIPANSITVIYDDTTISPPNTGDYITFSKNKQANSSSLKGYYADVKFVNHANEPVELFSIGSEVSESSK